jgi:hypothetical protein
VDACVGAPGDRQPDALAEQLLQGRLDLALDRAVAGLLGPAAESAAVVGDVKPVVRRQEA